MSQSESYFFLTLYCYYDTLYCPSECSYSEDSWQKTKRTSVLPVQRMTFYHTARSSQFNALDC